MTKHDEYDFSQFKGSFDSSMSPDSDFTERMTRMLEKESGAAERERKTTVLASPSRPNKEVPVPGRRTHPLTIVASVLVVLAVVVSSIWVLSGSPLEGEYGSAPSGIATLPADADVTPGSDVQLTAERFPGIPRVQEFFGMHGGLLIMRAPVNMENSPDTPTQEPNVNSNVLMAVDPNTQDIIWEQPFFGFHAIGASNGILIGLDIDWNASTSNGKSSMTIVALDLATGEQLWSIAGNSPEYWLSDTGVVILDEVVVVFAEDNMLEAYNLNNGELVWKTKYDPGEGFVQQYRQEDGTEWEEIHYSGSATNWNGKLVVINGDGLLQVFDAQSGEQSNSYQIELPPTEHSFPRNLELHASGDGVVLNEMLTESGGLQSQLIAFDPTDGTLLWSLELDGQQFVDVASNGNVALQSVKHESPNWLQRLLGNHGKTYYSLTWVDSKAGHVYLTTSPSEVENGSPRPTTDGDYVCSRTGTSEIACFDQAGTRHIVEIEPQYNFYVVDGVLYVATDDGLFRVELP